jgi:hypothetical protein
MIKIKGNKKSRKQTLEKLLCHMDKESTSEAWLMAFSLKSKKSRKEQITWEEVPMEENKIIHAR